MNDRQKERRRKERKNERKKEKKERKKEKKKKEERLKETQYYLTGDWLSSLIESSSSSKLVSKADRSAVPAE